LWLAVVEVPGPITMLNYMVVQMEQVVMEASRVPMEQVIILMNVEKQEALLPVVPL
jgi:hypothetical protein